MRPFSRTHSVIALAGGLVAMPAIAQIPFPAATRTAIEGALGRKGTPNPGGVLKFALPRTDLQVVLSGVTLKPALALGSWVAFQRISDHAEVMGDLVLLESEVAEVMGSLQQNGVEQTALHNHLLGESPRVMYMHIHAIGNPARIARAIRTALGFSGTPLSVPATPTAPPLPVTAAGVPAPPPLVLDTAAVARALGVHGKMNGSVYQLSIPRHEKIKDDKREIPSSMGISTAINFQPTGVGKAVVAGDFVLLGREVSPVLWALNENGISVTAIHSHMLSELPRLFFMHFWGNDDALKLARGLRAALDRTAAKR
ncbi:MAG: DUF1259 domain-containing protein [Gemmatimonadota bacterium]|nr:DUF1259 domain-containing protein [Gemmatimonadota bacterium]